jgi:hypothetical protein
VTLSRNILYYGSDAPLPEPIALKAGPLSLSFVSGEIRNVELGSREVLHRIYVAVRDRNWRTVPGMVLEVKKTIGPESFELQFEAENKKGDIDFCWRGSVVGQRDGTVSFTMQGAARSTFWRNRIGFCVLHSSAEWAGRSCSIETVDGGLRDRIFPRLISPHQVFSGVRAMSYEVQPGIKVQVRLEGETFETEDQRNWSDASYKTYCPPLSIPFPSTIRAGAKVSQAVTLALRGDVSRVGPKSAEGPTVIKLRKNSLPVPRIGLCVSSGNETLGAKAIQRLRALRLTHLRVDLNLTDEGYEPKLRRAADEATGIGAVLEAALFFTGDLTGAAQKELKALRATLDRIRPPVATWLVFQGSKDCALEDLVKVARAHLADYNPAAIFGGGSNAHFANLNRCRPSTNELDLLCYPLNPQVHAFDNATLVENLGAQGSMVQCAREFFNGVPLAISPITLRPRFNPDATAPESTPVADELPWEVDSRQISLFGAAWTIGSLKQIAEAGVYSATYYETAGWRGVMETDEGSPMPRRFPSLAGSVFPMYHSFADLGEFAGGRIFPTTSSAPSQIDGLALGKDGKRRLILTNFTPQARAVRVLAGAANGQFRVQSLDENSAEWAVEDPESFRAAPGKLLNFAAQGAELELGPYALIRLDLETSGSFEEMTA